MTPARFARFRRSRNDTADTALDAIGTPCSDRYSVTSFLTGVRVPLGVPAESIFGGVVSGARKHLIKGAFFLPCFGTRTPRALRAFGAAEMTLRTPHWTRSALRATIAIPSLRSLRGFESLNRRHLKETAKWFLSFLQSFLEPPDAVFALHDFRVQIRWRKLAIPSLRSLPKYNPKQKGHCPPQYTPSKSPKHHNILCFFFPRISLAVSHFPDLTAKYSQSRFHDLFPRFFPPFELPVSVYISEYGL